jgi:hypothetical protein
MAREDAQKPDWRAGPHGAGRLWHEVREFAIRNYLAALVGALAGIGGIGCLLGAYPAGREHLFEVFGWQVPARPSIEQDNIEQHNEVRRLTNALSEKKDALSEKKEEADQLQSSLTSTRRLLEDADREKMGAIQNLEQIQADLARRQEEARALQISLDEVSRLLKGSESERARLRLSLADANRLLTISEDERSRLVALAKSLQRK